MRESYSSKGQEQKMRREIAEEIFEYTQSLNKKERAFEDDHVEDRTVFDPGTEMSRIKEIPKEKRPAAISAFLQNLKAQNLILMDLHRACVKRITNWPDTTAEQLN